VRVRVAELEDELPYQAAHPGRGDLRRISQSESAIERFESVMRAEVR
jgi:hypothetical protein